MIQAEEYCLLEGESQTEEGSSGCGLRVGWFLYESHALWWPLCCLQEVASSRKGSFSPVTEAPKMSKCHKIEKKSKQAPSGISGDSFCKRSILSKWVGIFLQGLVLGLRAHPSCVRKLSSSPTAAVMQQRNSTAW